MKCSKELEPQCDHHIQNPMYTRMHPKKKIHTYNILRCFNRPICGGIGPVSLLLWRSLQSNISITLKV
jgi:hypothetical protein